MDETEKLRKGFNAGYLLEKHKPELSRLLQGSFTDNDDPYIQGFLQGSREYMQESLLRSQEPFDPDEADHSHDLDLLDRERDLELPDRDFEIEP